MKVLGLVSKTIKGTLRFIGKGFKYIMIFIALGFIINLIAYFTIGFMVF